MELLLEDNRTVVRRRGGEKRSTERARPAPQEPRTATPGVALEAATSGARWTVAALVGGDLLWCLLIVGLLRAIAGWEAGAVDEVVFMSGVLVPAVLAAIGLSGFYRPRVRHPATEMKQMFQLLGGMGGAAVLTSALFTRSPTVLALVATAALLGPFVLPVGRVLTRVLCSRLSWWGVPAVVVALDRSAEDLIDTLKRWPEMGIRPVAVLGNGEEVPSGDLFSGRPELAPYLAKAFDIPYLMVLGAEQAPPGGTKHLAHYTRFFDFVYRVDESEAGVFWSTGYSENGFRGYGVCRAASSVGAQGLKRTIDLLVATVVLVALAPLFLTIAVLIRYDSEGPVFYCQERLGKGGRTFTLMKFRSMYNNADERLEEVLASDPARRREYEEYHKLRDDPRVTPIGRILRRYSLDELPQLLNVVKGDMSLMGPRAYLPSELPEMKGLEAVILQTPPGVTGLWQVSGRSQLEFDDRIELDVHYVQNWSIWLDLYLLIRTGPIVVTGEGSA